MKQPLLYLMIAEIKSNLKTVAVYLVVSIPLLCIFTVFSYKYLDRPIAVYIYETFTYTRADIIPFTHSVKHITHFAYIAFPVFILIFYLIQGKPGFKSRFIIFIKEFSLNLIISYSVVHFLKYVFGRASVRCGSNYKMEVIAEYSRYGFNMFSNQRSFPSGHITLITTAMITILFFYPKFRTGCIGVIVLASALILYLDLHYLSDITTGIYLGITVPFCVHQLAKNNLINNYSITQASRAGIKKKPCINIKTKKSNIK